MNVQQAAESLGIILDEHRIKSEKKYTVIVEVVHGKRKYVGANKIPNIDVFKAKEEAISRFKFKLEQTDLITVRCMETTYADVPIDSMLTGTTWERQAIYSRWFEPEEIRLLINNGLEGNSISTSTES